MAYFPKGWYTYKFLITPREMSALLNNYYLIIHNAHVPREYTGSSIEEYIGAYKKLYGLFASGKKIVWSEHYGLFKTIALTSDMKSFTFGQLHTYEGSEYKNVQFAQPPVNLSPNSLLVNIADGRLHLSSSASYIQFPEYFIGMEFSYPKKIQYSDGDGFGPLISTETCTSFGDLNALKMSVRDITKTLTLQTDTDKRRTDIHISDSALADLKNSYAFGKLL